MSPADESTELYHDQWVIEWGKLILLGIALLFGFTLVLVALIVLDADDPRFAAALAFGTGTVGSIIGYITGNGRLASKGQPNVPAIGRAVPRE